MTVNTSKFGTWKQWKRDALRMHYQGKSHQEIADALGKPYFTITSHSTDLRILVGTTLDVDVNGL